MFRRPPSLPRTDTPCPCTTGVRSQCEGCVARFTTVERVQLRELMGVKKSCKREPFDREKLERSVRIACRKRPVEAVRMERLVSGIQRQLETQGETDVEADSIGQMVMDGLKALDPVAYIRFARVYKDFTEAKDFEDFPASLTRPGKGVAALR